MQSLKPQDLILLLLPHQKKVEQKTGNTNIRSGKTGKEKRGLRQELAIELSGENTGRRGIAR